MPQGEIPIPSEPETSRTEDILDSWKGIAAYLGRDTRTVQRWEQREGLPVHRHLHEEKGTVYAFKGELGEWRRSRRAKATNETGGGPAPEIGTEDSESASSVPPSKFLRLAVAAALICVFLAPLVFFYVGKWRTRLVAGQLPTIKSLAVLPLQNLSGDPAQDFLADSMTEELITDLSQISALRVTSRTSAIRFKGSGKSLPEIAKELNVDAIVEGSVLRSGDRVRVTAQLIYARNDSNLWAQSYDRDLKDVLTLQSIVASAIADEIKVKVTPGEQSRLKDLRPVNRNALEANLEGKFHYQKWAEQELQRGKKESSAEEVRKAIASFSQAIQEDPGYSAAYIGLADALLAHGPSSQSIERADLALEKAVQLDDVADTHLHIAKLRMQYKWDWNGAEREYKRALAANPNSAESHTAYADFLAYLGRNDERLRERTLSQELDPNHYRLDVIADYVEYGFRSYDNLEQNRRLLDERDPKNGFAHGVLATNYLRFGRYKEAVEQYEVCWTLYGYDDLVRALRPAIERGDYKAALSDVNKKIVALSQHEYIPPFLPAFLYSSLGDRDHAFAWLGKAYQEHNWCLLNLKNDEIWNPIRSDPRFADLLRRVGLPQ